MVVAIFLLELTNKNITSKETFIWLSIALVLALLGIGIRKLLPIAKYMMTVLMLVTALVYPFLIILYAYPIYLVYSSNGKYLFTKEYRGIVNGTPDFSPKSSKMFIILMILTFGMVLSIFLMAEFL
ncbi:MAG: hypothetical protein NE330_10760 [Lentisphaeraceae bacterium]|nr:hypothetical protein [Lentisphaeraceae bacterium]